MKKKLVQIFLVLFIIMSLSGCSWLKSTHEFKYEVTGTENSNYDITYLDETGNFKRIESVNRNWSYSWTEKKRYEETTSLYICAMNYGTVTVRIYEDGKIINENTNTGNRSMAVVNTSITAEF